MSRRVHVIVVLALATLSAVLYLPTLDDEWHYDDRAELTPLVREFSPRVDPSHYRGNAVRWLWAIDYRISGEAPTGYHVTNGLIHLGCSILVYWIAWMLATSARGRQRLLAAVTAAAVFCAHPLATQSVTYLTQRSSSFAALFFLLSLGSWIASRRATGTRRWLAWAVSLVALAVGLHAKHVVVMLPLVVLTYELLYRPEPRRLGFLLLVPLVLLAGWRALEYLPQVDVARPGPTGEHAAPGGVSAEAPGSHSALEYAYSQPAAILTYLRLFLLPRGQNLLHDLRPARSPLEPGVLGPLAVLIGLAVVAWRVRRTHPTATFGVALFFLTLLPTSSVFRSPGLIFEHRAYLPMAGLCLVLSDLALVAFAGRLRLGAATLTAVVVALAITTVRRNAVWNTELSLWTDVVAKSPELAEPRVNLGLALHQAGRLDEAEREYRQALAIRPDHPWALNNLGNVLRRRGADDEAERVWIAAVAARNQYADPRVNLGNLAMDRGDLLSAEGLYRDALELEPRAVAARYNLARCLQSGGRLEEAIREYEVLIEQEPASARFANDLGCARLVAGQLPAAEEDLRRAIALREDWEVPWYNLALVLDAAGRPEEAREARERVSSAPRDLDPDS